MPLDGAEKKRRTFQPALGIEAIFLSDRSRLNRRKINQAQVATIAALSFG